jgi:ankyrin repeat protein
MLDVNDKDEFNRTPLFRACQGGQLEAIKFLLFYGADASLADEDGHTPLHMLIMFSEQDIEEAAQCLITSSEKVELNAFSAESFDIQNYGVNSLEHLSTGQSVQSTQ